MEYLTQKSHKSKDLQLLLQRGDSFYATLRKRYAMTFYAALRKRYAMTNPGVLTLPLRKKRATSQRLAALCAEREGFEPPEVLPSTVFKTAAIDHSAISPVVLRVQS